MSTVVDISVLRVKKQNDIIALRVNPGAAELFVSLIHSSEGVDHSMLAHGFSCTRVSCIIVIHVVLSGYRCVPLLEHTGLLIETVYTVLAAQGLRYLRHSPKCIISLFGLYHFLLPCGTYRD